MIRSKILFTIFSLFLLSSASAFVGHQASQIVPGSFPSGNYNFDGNVGVW